MQPAENKDRGRYLSESIDFNYKMMVSAAKFATFYLLSKYSQTSFLLADPLEKQYRVTIDGVIECSCHDGNLGHCIHSLYILLRVFKLHEMHPYLYKYRYTDDDMKELLRISTTVKEAMSPVTKPEPSRPPQIVAIKLKAQTCLYKEPGLKNEPAPQKNEHPWPQFQPDTLCAICYDQIQNQTAIVDCHSCRNYYHTKCLRVWVTQQRKQSEDSSCPMCRADFEPAIVDRLAEMEKFYIQYHQAHGMQCSHCQKDILVRVYKCLLCAEYYLCADCYQKWEHKNHNRFVGKESKRTKWAVSERSEFNINKLNANLEFSKKFGAKDPEYRLLMGPKYEEFISTYIKKPSLREHVVESLLDVEKEIHKTYKKIDFTEKDIVCIMCKKNKIVGMKRLTCKHFIDERCLRFMLKSKIIKCPIDKQPFLPGLASLDINFQ